MAQAMALIFALVTVWGSSVHACHGPDHDVGMEHAAHTAAYSGDASVTHEGKAPAQSKLPHNVVHPCAADLMCHGGVAIVATGLAIALPLGAAEAFELSDRTHEGGLLAYLDRPPRATVQS